MKDDASLAEQLDKMNKYAKMSVTYQFGDSTETLNGDQIHGWLIANADGSVSVDSSKVSEYVSEMAKAHNTSNKAKTLKTSYGSTIQVSGGTYGWKINQAAETEALAAIIPPARVRRVSRSIPRRRRAMGQMTTATLTWRSI